MSPGSWSQPSVASTRRRISWAPRLSWAWSEQQVRRGAAESLSAPFRKFGHVFSVADGERVGTHPLPLGGGGLGRGGTTLERAKRLRSNQTDAEWRLWERLRARRFVGYKFKRQQPIGGYIVDFVCFARRLVVEVDGSQHMASPRDRRRDLWLAGEGFRVLRFWDNMVLQELEQRGGGNPVCAGSGGRPLSLTLPREGGRGQTAGPHARLRHNTLPYL